MNDEQVAWLAAAIVCAGMANEDTAGDATRDWAQVFYAALTDHWLEEEARS